MGEIADMMMDGTLCHECGALIDDTEASYDGACGYPRYCRECGGLPAMNGQKLMPGKMTSQRKRRNRR